MVFIITDIDTGSYLDNDAPYIFCSELSLLNQIIGNISTVLFQGFDKNQLKESQCH